MRVACIKRRGRLDVHIANKTSDLTRLFYNSLFLVRCLYCYTAEPAYNDTGLSETSPI